MGFFDVINISASALTAEKTRIDIIAKNIANARTTRSTGGMPYRRQVPIFKEQDIGMFETILHEKLEKGQLRGVKISKIEEDKTPFKMIYEPGHPDANKDGYVLMPNVDIVKEMVDMISAQRAYDSNVTAINTYKALISRALEIGRR